MKIVIDISEDELDAIKYLKVKGWASRHELLILNGTPLPKLHSGLITKEQAIELVEFYQINPQHFDFVNLIDEIKNEKPIIPADKEDD